jgi:hypothetical protein
MDDLQASLFAPTGPVMARALCRQTEARIARLEPYLSSAECFRLYSELSLVALLLDRMELHISATPDYRDAQLAVAIAPSAPPAEETRLHWRSPRGARRGAPNRERALV